LDNSLSLPFAFKGADKVIQALVVLLQALQVVSQFVSPLLNHIHILLQNVLNKVEIGSSMLQALLRLLALALATKLIHLQHCLSVFIQAIEGALNVVQGLRQLLDVVLLPSNCMGVVNPSSNRLGLN